MTKHARRLLAYFQRRQGFLHNVLEGMAFGSEIYRSKRIRGYPHKSELEAMRGDWTRIGGDFAKAIAHEEAEAAQGKVSGK